MSGKSGIGIEVVRRFLPPRHQDTKELRNGGSECPRSVSQGKSDAVGDAGGGEAFGVEDVVEQGRDEPAFVEGDRDDVGCEATMQEKLGDDCPEAADLEVIFEGDDKACLFDG